MHLSETKHNLPGIYPFNKYSLFFLNLDRLTAYSAMFWIIYLVVSNKIYSTALIIESVLALVSLYLSENYPLNKTQFTVMHSIWHLLAFDIAYRVVTFQV